MYINGKKVRLQLWDQGLNKNPESTFQPLYTRHVSGCIVVANTSNPESIKRAIKWKRCFDEKTKIQNEPSIPCSLFINHDKIEEEPEFQITHLENNHDNEVTEISMQFKLDT
jgi:hypothetical protein